MFEIMTGDEMMLPWGLGVIDLQLDEVCEEMSVNNNIVENTISIRSSYANEDNVLTNSELIIRLKLFFLY